MRRRTILPPIRPRPIMPSCMATPSGQGALDCGVEHRQPLFEITLQVYAQGAAAAPGQHLEIAARLRRLDHSETGLLPGNGKIVAVIGGELQEHAAVWTALVGLTGGMQKARPEFSAGGDMAFVTNREPDALQTIDVIPVTLYIGEQGDIVAVADAAEMSF